MRKLVSTIEKLGINLQPVECPKCQERMPTLRKPELAQIAFGGWTCPKCGTRMDKWGRPLEQPENT